MIKHPFFLIEYLLRYIYCQTLTVILEVILAIAAFPRSEWSRLVVCYLTCMLFDMTNATKIRQHKVCINCLGFNLTLTNLVCACVVVCFACKLCNNIRPYLAHFQLLSTHNTWTNNTTTACYSNMSIRIFSAA